MARAQAFPVLDPLDRRLNAWRPDLADRALRNRVTADRYAAGEPARVSVPVADLRARPKLSAGVEHQLVLGEAVRVFDRSDGWAWLQCIRDCYVGWTRDDNLATDIPDPTHIVCVPRTFVYPAPDLKRPASSALSMGTRLRPVAEETTRGTKYAVLANGQAVIAGHIRPMEQVDRDFVAVASRFLATPYLWGGSTGFGLDCSGLVELSMRMAGRQVLRDSDMQAATIGEILDPAIPHGHLQRGDLVFWRGHVAIVEGNGNLLHANGYTMDVASEPVDQALARIATLFENPIGYRRPGPDPGQ